MTFLRNCIIIYLFSFSLALLAQTVDKPVSTENSINDKQTSQQQEQANEPQESGKKQSGYQVFKPSEEISEDLSVPFPTDI